MATQNYGYQGPPEEVDPRDKHTLSCTVWTSSDPLIGCDCGTGETTAERLDRLVPRSGRRAS